MPRRGSPELRARAVLAEQRLARQPTRKRTRQRHHQPEPAHQQCFDAEPDIREGRLTRLLPEFTGEAVPITAVIPSRRYVPTRVRSVLKYLSVRYAMI